MNKKGQALVEFIIIMPIMIFLLLAIVDFGTFNFDKNKMENILTNVSKMYSNKETRNEIEKYVSNNDKTVDVKIITGDKYDTIKLTKKHNFLTPGMDKIFSSDDIVVEGVIYNE